MIPDNEVRSQLDRILASPAFEAADRAKAFLRFVITSTLEGRSGEIKESVIAVEALGRSTSFDPKSDPIVRVEAGRLRTRLKDYYDSAGADDPIVITLPKGGYVPEFVRSAEPATPSRQRKPAVVFTAGLLAGIVAAAVVFLAVRRPQEAGEGLRLSVLPPTGAAIQSSRISPDGKTVAFTALRNNRTMIWLRDLASSEAREIPGTEGATQPFWSPDSRSLAFFGTNQLKRVEMSGGPAQVICPATIPLGGGSWSPSGVIVFSPKPDGVLFRVAASGGEPQPVTVLDISRHELRHRSPEFLPDGRHFLYVASTDQPNGMTLRVGSVDSTESKVLLEGGGNAAFAPPGSLLFYFHGALMAQPFDPDRLTLGGGRSAVAPEAFYRDGRADFSVSRNGVMAYRPGSRKRLKLGWFDRVGRLVQNLGGPNDYSALRLSPDEKRLVFCEEDDFSGNSPIWMMDLGRGQVSRVSGPLHASFFPAWSPDGSSVLHSSGSERRTQLVRQSLTSARTEPVLDSPGAKFVSDWSSDGNFVAYATAWPDFGRLKTVVLDLRKAALNQNAEVLVMDSPYSEAEAVFSPDITPTGPRWIAYTSTDSGRREVYVRRFPQGDRKWPISSAGGWQPLWRSDGRELFFLAPDGTLMAADVRAGTNFEPGVPHALFRTTIAGRAGGEVPSKAYAVSRDGQRFLVNQAGADESSRGSISIVTHWSGSQR